MLLLQHLGDVDGAVAALIAAKEWREGLRVAYANGRADLVDTDLVPAAAQVRHTRALYTCTSCGGPAQSRAGDEHVVVASPQQTNVKSIKDLTAVVGRVEQLNSVD